MAVMLVAGNPESGMLHSIFDKVRPLTTNIAIEMGYASGRQSEMLFATGVILFIFIMIVNLTLIRLTSVTSKDEKPKHRRYNTQEKKPGKEEGVKA